MKNTVKYDIRTAGNSIGGRQGWAYVCNSGEVTVLKADLDKPQEYKDYEQFEDAKVVWNYRGTEAYHTCTLARNSCHGEAFWELSSSGCALTASFGLSDAMEMIHNAQLPIVRTDKVIAIAQYNSKAAFLSLYKVDKVDIHCSTVAKLIPLNDEEMSKVLKNINKWLNR